MDHRSHFSYASLLMRSLNPFGPYKYQEKMGKLFEVISNLYAYLNPYGFRHRSRGVKCDKNEIIYKSLEETLVKRAFINIKIETKHCVSSKVNTLSIAKRTTGPA